MRIGISGKIASGKTSVANYIMNIHNSYKMSFATPLKELERIHSSFPSSEWYNRISEIASRLAMAVGSPERSWDITKAIVEGFHIFKPTPGVKNRALLQYIGTEVVRDKLGDKSWAKYLTASIKHPNVVVDDLRFISEAEELKDSGFVLIRLEISPEVQARRIKELYGEMDQSKLTHRSEVELDNYSDFDRIINNDSNWEGTLRQIDNLIGMKMEASL